MTVEDAIHQYIPTIEGWSTPEKCIKMVECIREVKPDYSFEIGIYGGRGIISMAMAHREINHGVAVGIDPWSVAPTQEGRNVEENDNWWASLDFYGIQQAFIHHVLAHHLLDFCHWYRLTSQKTLLLFDDDSIGFMHQDGNHSAEVSCWEVENWDSKIKQGGYWMMDDTNWPSTQEAQKLILTLGYEEVHNEGGWKLYKKQ